MARRLLVPPSMPPTSLTRPLALLVTVNSQEFAQASRWLSPSWRVVWGYPLGEVLEWLELLNPRLGVVVVSIDRSQGRNPAQLSQLLERVNPVPVIAIAATDRRRELLDLGVTEVLPRPVDYQQLDDRMREAYRQWPRSIGEAPPLRPGGLPRQDPTAEASKPAL